MYEVIDNIVNKQYADQIEKTFLGGGIPWIYREHLTHGERGAYGFMCQLLSNPATQDKLSFVMPLIYSAADRVNFTVENCIAARTAIQTPSNSPKSHDFFHVDIGSLHLVMLYYVNDSDGPTVISTKKHQHGEDLSLPEDCEIEILDKIEPRKNRVLVFDGRHYHASGIPKQAPRCVINFNLLGYFNNK